MKWKNKDKILLLTSFLLLIVFSIPSISARPANVSATLTSDLTIKGWSWNKSDYTAFTGPAQEVGVEEPVRIYIDDTNPNYNWSKTAADNDWCSGSGTWRDPYVIEGLYINAEGVGACIYIHRTTRYYIIRNNWFDYTGPNKYCCGVVTRHVEKGTITNNIMTYNHRCVFLDLNSANTTVSNNIMLNDHSTTGISSRAIDIGGGYNITIRDNFIFNATAGMGLYGTYDNIIVNNYIENTIYGSSFDECPIKILSCDNSTIKDNILAGAFAQGTFTVSEVDCEGNIIEGNGATTNDPFAVSALHTSQVNPSLIGLEGSNYNYIGYNMILKQSGAEAIPGYNFYIVLGILSLMAVISIVLVINKRAKY